MQDVSAPYRSEMRFVIEKRSLTDARGKPLAQAAEAEITVREAESVDDAIRLSIRDDGAELVGSVLRFPGSQAIATARKSSSVYTLQVGPASDAHLPIGR